MIKTIVLKMDATKLILTGSDNIDVEVLKALNGAKARVITDPIKLPDGDITSGLILELENKTRGPEGIIGNDNIKD